MDTTKTKLKEFVERKKWSAEVPTIIRSTDGEEYLTFHDGNGFYLNRQDMQLVVEELTKTLKLGSDFDEFIEEHNTKRLIGYSYRVKKHNEELFKLPFKQLKMNVKEFNTHKKKWSFVCANCQTKVTSEKNVKYISFSPSPEFDIIEYDPFTRACSVGCAKVVAKDMILEWLDWQGEESRYFYTENLSEQIDEYIKNHVINK